MAQQDDACTMLDDEHNEAIRLFEQYKAARDGSRRQVLARQLCHELLVHMQIEDEIFYPAFLQATGDTHRVDDSKREHQEARDLIAKVDKDPLDARVMLDLEDAILHHVNDEREKMFPEARRAKGLDLERLARQLAARKAELTAAHPA
jgi:hypothetical protein